MNNSREEEDGYGEAGFEADSEGSDCENIVTNLQIVQAVKIEESTMETEPDLNENTELDLSMLTTSSTSLNYSPKIIDSIVKRPKKVDISKFNRSNRKSKNCAIFYFKHSDTDGEHRGLSSSQGSEAFKSEGPSSEEDEWIFTDRTKGECEEDEDVLDGIYELKNDLTLDFGDDFLLEDELIVPDCNGNSERRNTLKNDEDVFLKTKKVQRSYTKVS